MVKKNSAAVDPSSCMVLENLWKQRDSHATEGVPITFAAFHEIFQI